MAYLKQEWIDHVTVVEKARMDHIEDGIVLLDETLRDLIDSGVGGPPGPEGPAGPEGPRGARGPTGLQGPAGPDGVQGPEGPQGSAGTGINMKGRVPTIADLPPTGNAIGDAYVVEADDDNLYMWDGGQWVLVGPIHGPVGPSGPQGATGPQGPVGPEGPQGPQGIPGGWSVAAKIVGPGNYTMVPSDAGWIVETSGLAPATNVILPNRTDFAQGTVIEVYQIGYEPTTITPQAGVGLQGSYGVGAVRLLGTHTRAGLRLRYASPPQWVVHGDIQKI